MLLHKHIFPLYVLSGFLEARALVYIFFPLSSCFQNLVMQLALGKDLLIKFLNALLQTCHTLVRQVVVLSSLEGGGKTGQRGQRDTHIGLFMNWTAFLYLQLRSSQ